MFPKTGKIRSTKEEEKNRFVTHFWKIIFRKKLKYCFLHFTKCKHFIHWNDPILNMHIVFILEIKKFLRKAFSFLLPNKPIFLSFLSKQVNYALWRQKILSFNKLMQYITWVITFCFVVASACWTSYESCTVCSCSAFKSQGFHLICSYYFVCWLYYSETNWWSCYWCIGACIIELVSGYECWGGR